MSRAAGRAVWVAVVALAACGPARPEKLRNPVHRPRPPEPVKPSATGGWYHVRFDVATLNLEQKGVRIGSEQFQIDEYADEIEVTSTSQLSAAGAHRLLESSLSTDKAWRPLRGTFLDAKDGGTRSTLAGDPLRLSIQAATQPVREIRATGPVDLFIADNTMAHFSLLCAIAGPANLTAFPAMHVYIGPDQIHYPDGLTARRFNLGGAVGGSVFCRDRRLIAVDVPFAAFTAIRDGWDAAIRKVLPPPLLSESWRRLDPSEHLRKVKVARGRHGAAAVLACSLVVPDVPVRKERVPGVVFITGSGAQDRDENAVGPGGIKLSPFRVLADALRDAGIASLRCDDRGTGESTGDYGAATVETYVADTAAALRALRAEPRVDPARTGLVGHSEGGVIAQLVATRDRRLAGIALLASPGRPLDVVLLEQIARAQRRAGITDLDALDRHRAAFEAIRTGAALPATPEAAEWKGGEAWLRSHLRHDPAVIAAKLGEVAVLIAQGGKDQQVAVDDAEALEAAYHRAGNQDVAYRYYPDLNHMFVASKTGDIAEYADPDARIDPRIGADLVLFFAGR